MSSQPRLHPIHEVPGVLYTPIEGRARIQGTGLEVWEVCNVFRGVGGDFERLQTAFDWLTHDQLRAALSFFERNPEFVNESISTNDAIEAEFRQNHPQSVSPFDL